MAGADCATLTLIPHTHTHTPTAWHIPDNKIPSTLIVLAAGVFPFGTAFIEVYFVMASMWSHKTYYIFGFLIAVLVLTLIVVAEARPGASDTTQDY